MSDSTAHFAHARQQLACAIDPRDPDYDDPRADRVCDEAVEGQLILDHAPCELLRPRRALRGKCTPTLFGNFCARSTTKKQSTFLKALHSGVQPERCGQDIADWPCNGSTASHDQHSQLRRRQGHGRACTA